MGVPELALGQGRQAQGGQGDIVSANPSALREYSTAAVDMLDPLAADAGDFGPALTAFGSVAAEASAEIPGWGWYPGWTGSPGFRLDELIADWGQLDAFVGQVGDAIVAAEGLSEAEADRVVRVPMADLLPHGVGYATRDEAIAAANAAANLMEEVWEEGDLDRLDEVIGALERGQWDPAFAATFSNRVGFEGYMDAMHMIEMSYHRGRDGDLATDGIAEVQVLANVLTTALATLPPSERNTLPVDDGRGELVHLADEDRLDVSFLHDLYFYDPDGERYYGEYVSEDQHRAVEQRLSVLLGLTDPPTRVAIEIANQRMQDLLVKFDHMIGFRGSSWGDHADPVVNYASMLARNPDASAAWLDRRLPDDLRDRHGGLRTDATYLDLVLAQHGVVFLDGGQALADMVENGVTHPDAAISENLMTIALEVVTDEGEILAAPMHEALGEGVAHNLHLFDGWINDGWDDLDRGDGPPDNAVRSRNFLGLVMASDDAADAIWVALEEFSIAEIAAAPADGRPRTDRLREIGAIHGVVVDGENKALRDSAEAWIARQQRNAGGVNFIANLPGYIPVVGDVYSGVKDASELAGAEVGDFVFPADWDRLDDADREGELRRIATDVDMAVLLALAENPDRADVPIREMDDEQRQEFIDWAFSSTVDDPDDHDSLAAHSWRASGQMSVRR